MNSRTLFARAKNALMMRDYQTALDFTAQLIGEYPDNPQLHLFAGNIYSRLKENNLAIQSYQKVIELDPENPEAHNNIGVIYRYIENIPAAIGAIEHALRLVPGRADILYNLGNVYKQIEDYARAIGYYKEAITADPGFLLAYNNWGTTLQKLGKEKEAEKIFRDGLSADPNNPTLRYNLGICLQNQKRDREAVNEFSLALRSAPAWQDGLNNLGVSLERTGEAEKAYSVFKRALKLNPKAAKVRNNMAVVLGAMGRDEEASKLLKETLAADPHYSRAAVNLEAIQEKNGLYLDAFSSLRSLLEHDRDNVDLRIRFATVCLELKKMNLARESISWLVERHSRNSRGYALLGRYQELTGKRQEAVMSYLKALNLEPSDHATRMNLALLYKDLKQNGQAIAQTSQILARDEYHYDARLLMGKLYLLDNLYAEALNILEPLFEMHPDDEELITALIRGYRGDGQRQKVVELTEEMFNLRNPKDGDLDLDALDQQLSAYEESLEEFAAEHEALWEENLRKLTSPQGETEEGSSREGDSLIFERIPDLDRPAPIIDIGGIEPVIAINEDEEVIHLSEMEEEIEDFMIEEAKREAVRKEREKERLAQASSSAGSGKGGDSSGAGGTDQRGSSGGALPQPINITLGTPGSGLQFQIPKGGAHMRVSTKTVKRTRGKRPKAGKPGSAGNRPRPSDEQSISREAPSFDGMDPEYIYADEQIPGKSDSGVDGEKSARLFDYLQGLINYLPEEQKNDFETSEVKLKLEVLKERLKGRHGLISHLVRPEAELLKTLRSDIDSRKREPKEESVALSEGNISDTLSYIQDLSVYHPNKEIGVALHHKIADIVHTIRKKNGST